MAILVELSPEAEARLAAKAVLRDIARKSMREACCRKALFPTPRERAF